MKTNMTTQLTLTQAESQLIASLSQQRGVTQEEILHEAIEQFLAAHQAEVRRAALQGACGIWRDRDDLPDFAQLRAEMDR